MCKYSVKRVSRGVLCGAHKLHSSVKLLIRWNYRFSRIMQREEGCGRHTGVWTGLDIKQVESHATRRVESLRCKRGLYWDRTSGRSLSSMPLILQCICIAPLLRRVILRHGTHNLIRIFILFVNIITYDRITFDNSVVHY